MDEELFGEGSSSEEEHEEGVENTTEQQQESAEEESSDGGEEEADQNVASGSGSEAESKESSAEEEKSGEESAGEQEASDEENAEETEDKETQEASGNDSSDGEEEAEGAAEASGGEESPTAAQEESDEGGSEAGGETPVHSDSDGEAEQLETSADAAKSEEEDSDGDNKETKETAESGSEEEEDNKETKDSDSGSDIGGKRPKLTGGSDASSSDENAGDPTQSAAQEDLFGDADDISSSDDDEKMETEKNKPEEEEPTRKPMLYSDDEDEEGVKQPAEEEQQETRIEVEIPKINTDLGNSVHFVRFPNFVSVETRPFDPTVYEDEIEDDELLDEEGRTRLKLKVENTIRWKKYTDENGMQLTESNARLVRWSDGSLSMHLGSEIFDVHVMPLQGDHNHLFIRQGTGLQGQAVFKTKLTFRPHSTKSATHRKMTSRLAMRLNQNQQKVRVLPIAGQDPESRKAKLMKEEEDQLRAHMRREAQKRRMREKAHARGLNTNYLDDRLDEEEDSGAISVSAIKNTFRPGFGGGRMNIYTSDSDSGDEKQLTNVKRRLESDSEDSDEGVDKSQRNKKKSEEGEGEKKTKKYVVSDSEESENEDNKETNNETSENATESQEQPSDSSDE
ncbi:uncharacterized protein LOC120338085 [Styela clava]